MHFIQLHLVRKAACLAAVASALATLSGCQGIVSTPVLSQVRVITASPDAPGLDIYQGTGALASNLGYGTITSYVPTEPGTYSISANAAGTNQVLATAKNTFAIDTQYTVLIGNSAASLQETILRDQSQPAAPGQIGLRFLDQSTRAGGVDIYLVPAGQKITAVAPLITNLTFGLNTGYLNVPTGTYTIVMVPAGTIPNSTTVAMYNGPQVAYTSGSSSTIVLIDQQVVTSPGVQVITAVDYVNPTATN
jgi:hypothetical protein